MALYLVLLSTILAFSLTSTEQYASSLDSMKNASGHSITRADTGRYTKKVNPQPLSVNVHQAMNNKTEQLYSVDTAHPSLHDTSMSGGVQPTTASTSTTTTPKSCPQSGYQLYPGFNCYKAFPSRDGIKTWTNAREQCMGDGGDLMVIETERERKDVFIPLYNSAKLYFLPWVGVYIPQAGSDFMTVKGEPALSTWWESDYPVKDADSKCALAETTGLLVNSNCAYNLTFICEISL